MSDELPEGWAPTTFADLVQELRNGVSPRPSIDPPGTPILRISAVRPGSVSLEDVRYLPRGDEYLLMFGLRDGDLLFTRYNGSLDLVGVCGLVKGLRGRPRLYPDKLMRVRLNERAVLPEYIEGYFQSPQARAAIVAIAKSSAGQQGISGGDLKGQFVPVAPLAEQHRIVSKVDGLLARVNAARDRLEKVPLLLKRFRQAVLKKAFRGELTEDWRRDHGLSDDWGQARIDEVASVGTGSTPLRSDSAFYAATGTPWITSAATGSPFVTKAEEFVTAAAISAHRLKKYPVGTLLVAMYGEGRTRGQVTELCLPATINQACAAIVVNESLAVTGFVKLLLESSYYQMREKAEGGNQPNLNLTKIKEFPVPLPVLQEQREIVAAAKCLLARADALDVAVECAQRALDRLPQAILRKAFSGELVPTEAELAAAAGRPFESAQELLHEIDASGSQQPAKAAAPRAKQQGSAGRSGNQPDSPSARCSPRHQEGTRRLGGPVS